MYVAAVCAHIGIVLKHTDYTELNALCYTQFQKHSVLLQNAWIIATNIAT